MKEIIPVTFETLDEKTRQLVRESERALSTAYAPYSKFYVGAALLLADDSVIIGSNQENAAYPSGLCAERVALFAAGSQRHGTVIRKLAIVARSAANGELVPATPCGSCRQVMLESETQQRSPIEIIMMWEPGRWLVVPSAQYLLPFSFTKDHLH